MSSEENNEELILTALAGNEQATEALLQMHQGLIWSLANRLHCNIISKEELIQAGQLGFMCALRRYNTSKKAKFTTYAVPWILGEMRQTIKRLEIDGYSLDQPIDDDCTTLHDFISGTETLNLSWVDLRLAISKLNAEEQMLLCLRFFRDKSQKESAILLRKSQTQISRIERRALDTLRIMLS